MGGISERLPTRSMHVSNPDVQNYDLQKSCPRPFSHASAFQTLAYRFANTLSASK